MTPVETVETTSLLSGWLMFGFFIIGAIVGAFIFALLNRHLKPPVEQRDVVSEQQLKNYRAAVLRHFNQTSLILQQLGTDYQNLTTHISQSMHELCTTPDGKPVIPPIFPSTTPHSSKEHEHVVMPRTYVDPHKSHKE